MDTLRRSARKSSIDMERQKVIVEQMKWYRYITMNAYNKIPRKSFDFNSTIQAKVWKNKKMDYMSYETYDLKDIRDGD